jgi:hypothetical protein
MSLKGQEMQDIDCDRVNAVTKEVLGSLMLSISRGVFGAAETQTILQLAGIINQLNDRIKLLQNEAAVYKQQSNIQKQAEMMTPPRVTAGPTQV